MKATHLTKADFLTKVANYETNPNEWKFLGERPALIDFYATWCGPCKMLAPVLDELADEYQGQVDIYKVDVDAEEELAALFGIRSVPSLLFVPMAGSPQHDRTASGFQDRKSTRKTGELVTRASGLFLSLFPAFSGAFTTDAFYYITDFFGNESLR